MCLRQHLARPFVGLGMLKRASWCFACVLDAGWRSFVMHTHQCERTSQRALQAGVYATRLRRTRGEGGEFNNQAQDVLVCIPQDSAASILT
jgi:hypothetical protein